MGMPKSLPDGLLEIITQWPCRQQQLRQLSAVLSPSLPNPSALVAHGAHATGKTGVVRSYISNTRLDHAFIDCRECITARHLLERTVAAVQSARHGDNTIPSQRCENANALAVQLQQLLEGVPKFIIVYDGIDKLREPSPTLLPALARLGEIIPALTVLMIVQHPGSRFLHQAGVPHIYFPPYTRDQSLQIVSRNPPDIFLDPPPAEIEYDDEVHEEDKAWLWSRYCAAVWDSLAQNAARDLVAFRDLCHKLWRPFVEPIVKGDFGTRDFSRLLVAQRRLFQDETVLLDRIVSTTANPTQPPQPDLPYYPKWLLIAAHLASFNPAKLDALYFMKATERKGRKRGGGTARSGGGRTSQVRKMPRHLLAPSAFTIDRLLAILHAILPHDLRTTIDIYAQIATLTGLRLLVRGGTLGSNDPLEAGGKWRVGSAVSWEYVQALARSLDFNLVDYVAE